ncbi:MAG TPA: caspase family protein, partial [Saprospiraceae bacterium]|nr:caspase family protein [Saprospiraceae bacterium]
MERGIKLPQSSSEWGFKGENYLIIIGIDKYQYWKPLNNAVKDVRDIALLLTERYQFEPKHVITLIDDQATEDSIRQHLLDIKRNITKEDNLVVFFSGHGYYDVDLDEGYWVPANARKDSPSDYISNSDVLKWIRAIKTHHTLVIVDSCFSGSLVSQSRSEVLSEKYPSSRIFASGRKELVEDGAPGTNSPFAKAILSRLTYNTDRVMRASELIQNVTKSVESNGGQAPIEGRIKEAGDEGGEFVFHLKVTEEEIWNSIVASNTPVEYSKYLEYFPDGQHALAARTKLSELTDEEDWKKALELSTAQAYTIYLEAHPRGCYNEEALGRLEELEEDDAWQKAKTRNSVSSFMDYLRKYPEGKFDSLARKNLDHLKRDLKQNEQDLVSNELEGLGDTHIRTKDNKEQYKTLINEGEGFFSQMQYDKSIDKYQQALNLAEAHFVPNKNFVIQRIDLARKRIKYSEFLCDGDDALKSHNFDLAIEYYKQAQSYDDTIQVRNNIEHAKRRGLILQPPPVPVVHKTKSSKRSPVFWVVGVLLLLVLGVVGYVASEFRSDSTTYSPDYKKDYEESAITAEPVPAYEDPVSNTPANTFDMIIGSWHVEDR